MSEGFSRQRSWHVRVSGGRDGGLALEHDDAVREVGRHDEVVLDDERSLLGVQDEALDDFARDDTLLGIQESGRIREQQDV